jgi:hypothetical protein
MDRLRGEIVTRVMPTRLVLTMSLACWMAFAPGGYGQARPSSPVQPGRLVIHPLYENVQSDLVTAIQTVVRDTLAWRTWWDLLTGRNGNTPPPSVDFDTDMIVLVGSGNHSVNGFKVRIDSIVRRRGALAIHVIDVGPGERCPAGTWPNQPVVAVRVARHAETSRFIIRTLRTRC